MITLIPRQALNAQTLLDMMRLQLNWLERELATLQQTIGNLNPPDASYRTFASLRGVWAGVSVSEQDFNAARLTLPDEFA